jgi:hypothetical protein
MQSADEIGRRKAVLHDELNAECGIFCFVVSAKVDSAVLSDDVGPFAAAVV